MSASAPLSIRKVETEADFNTLLTFPWTLYKDDPYWVPPLVSRHRAKLDKKKSTAWEYMEGDYFIAWRSEQPVGTIAAFINPRHNDYWDENIGFFGYFEVYDDQEAANALLNAAEELVRSYGCTALRGPFTFSTNAECGILIEGFDDPPVFMYPYNYSYYQRLLENAPGFEKVMDLVSYDISLEKVEQAGNVKRVFQVTSRNNKRRNITIRGPNTKQLSQEFTLLKNVYNKAWEKNWGFVPFSERELDELVDELGDIFHPRLTFFAEVDGQLIGFLLGFPDVNQALHRAYPRPGKPEIVSLLQTLWHWKIRSKITRLRIMLLGVENTYRSIGADAAMFAEAYKAGADLGWNADGGWVLENNDSMNRLATTMGGQVYKRLRLYERPLL